RTNHRKKKPLKIVFETVTQEKKTLRYIASYDKVPPAGYEFVPVGFPDLTERCKKKCQEKNLQFQTVSTEPVNKAHLDPGKVSYHIHRIGNHFPVDVVRESCVWLGYHALGGGKFSKYDLALDRSLKRHSAKGEKAQIRTAIQELFPRIPEADLENIVTHAWKEGSNRVGTANMPLTRQVQLAVCAFVRHKYTDYDNLLKSVGYKEARAIVEPHTLKQLKAWRGEDSKHGEMEEVFREFIVIDSDDESDDENEGSIQADNESHTSIEFVSHAAQGDD
ncbi:hypothetical protein NA57DRAFT_27594, partial [Rhizodiscina lignyota]